MSRVGVLVVVLVAAAASAFAQDNWLGGAGNWSNDVLWSIGVPMPAEDVLIYSGAHDIVTLDVSPTINSLTLGGTENGFPSELTDGGLARTLTISNGLTMGRTGFLYLFGASNVTAGSDSSNSGVVIVEHGSKLQVFGDLNNSNFWGTGLTTSFGGGNMVNVTGNLTNSGSFGLVGPNDMATIGGNVINTTAASVFFVYGNGAMATIGGLANSGYVELGNRSTLQINGDATNFLGGVLFTNFASGSGGSTLNITGTLYNNAGAQFILYGPMDMANLGGLFNSGLVAVQSESTLQINGDLKNFGLLTTNGGGGNTLNITGTLYNYNTLRVMGAADMATIAGVSNSGYMDLENGSALLIHGDAYNSGTLATDGSGGGNTLNITGMLTNSLHAIVQLLGTGDVANIGSLNNNGFFQLAGTGDVANIGTLNNSRRMYVGPGATLNLTNQPNGITDVIALSEFDLAGIFDAGSNNGFHLLTSVEGSLILENARTVTPTPIGGTFTVGSTGSIEVLNGTTVNINGNVIVDPGGIFSVKDPLPTTVNIAGMLTNLGGQVTVVGTNAFLSAGGIGNGGMLTLPEGSTVNVANGFYQLASGTLGETFGVSGFGIIVVNGGPVALDGTLDVLLDAGYGPAVGSTFKFFLFNPGALSGTFASIQNDIFNAGTEKWVLVYNDAGGFLELEAMPTGVTPEPSSLLLWCSGLIVGVGILRRKLTL